MPAIPAAKVTVVTVKPADVPLPAGYVSQTAEFAQVEVRARVSGFAQRLYAEAGR